MLEYADDRWPATPGTLDRSDVAANLTWLSTLVSRDVMHCANINVAYVLLDVDHASVTLVSMVIDHDGFIDVERGEPLWEP